MVHVLETVAREHHVETLGDAFVDRIGVAIAQIEPLRAGDDLVGSTANVENAAGEPGAFFLGQNLPRL
jgi:hypothetical protein